MNNNEDIDLYAEELEDDDLEFDQEIDNEMDQETPKKQKEVEIEVLDEDDEDEDEYLDRDDPGDDSEFDDNDEDEDPEKDDDDDVKENRTQSMKPSFMMGGDMSDDDDDNIDSDEETDDNYLQKFNEETQKNIISEFHPELQTHNTSEIEALSRVVRNEDGIVIDPLHKTVPFITRYEKARIIGERAKQLNYGAIPMVQVDATVIDGYLIALKEYEEKKIPFIVKRPMPNGGCEYWKFKDLEQI